MRKNILILGHSNASQFVDIYNQYYAIFPPDKYEVTVAYLTNDKNAVDDRLQAENVLALNIPKKKLRYLKIGVIKNLLTYCQKKQFQMVICHRYKPAYILLWVSKFYKIPALIFVMHELGTMRSWGRQWLLTTLFKGNMLFAGVSDSVRDDMRKDLKRLPASHIQTLYNVMDTDLMEPQLLTREVARERLNIAKDDFVFGNLGRLVINKDQATLIDAFIHLKEKGLKARLFILGEGELLTTLKSKAQASPYAADIVFCGYVANASNYMKAFDCFVLSSIQEAFGRVLIEAMLAKLPIIATTVNGIPEVVENAGVLVPAKNALALAAEMEKIYHMSHDSRAQIGEKAYQHVQNKFSVHTFKQRFWKLPLLAVL